MKKLASLLVVTICLVFARPGSATSAGLVQRTVNGAQMVWMFACGLDHVMRTATITDAGFSNWTTVGGAPSCATQPSVLKEPGGTPREVIGVYYRSTTNRLVELWYPSNGLLEISDLSKQAGLGTIDGFPLVGDRGNNSDQRVAILTVQHSTQRIVSLDLYSNSWHLHPVLMADGSAAITPYPEPQFVASYEQYNRPMMITTGTDGAYSVFARTAWTQSYRQDSEVGYPTDIGSGARVPTFGAPDSACNTAGCVLHVDLDTYALMWHSLDGARAGVLSCGHFSCRSARRAPLTSPDGLTTVAYGGSALGDMIKYQFQSSQVEVDFPTDAVTVPTMIVGADATYNGAAVFAQFTGLGYDLVLTFGGALTFLGYPSPGLLLE